jgi:hypothetical protein
MTLSRERLKRLSRPAAIKSSEAIRFRSMVCADI